MKWVIRVVVLALFVVSAIYIFGIGAAQKRLPEISGVMLGPDTDIIQGSLYRHDNCHFNAKGMQAHADGWLGALTKGTR